MPGMIYPNGYEDMERKRDVGKCEGEARVGLLLAVEDNNRLKESRSEKVRMVAVSTKRGRCSAFKRVS